MRPPTLSNRNKTATRAGPRFSSYRYVCTYLSVRNTKKKRKKGALSIPCAPPSQRSGTSYDDDARSQMERNGTEAAAPPVAVHVRCECCWLMWGGDWCSVLQDSAGLGCGVWIGGGGKYGSSSAETYLARCCSKSKVKRLRKPMIGLANITTLNP